MGLSLRFGATVILLVTVGVLLGCSGLAEKGRELEAQGNLARAVSLYREALLEDPDNAEILAALGADLMLLGKYDEALPVQERVASLDPRDVQTRIELGFNYLNHQDRATDAVQALGEAASLDTTAQHLTFLAQAQIVSGDGESAERTLRNAIDLDPRYGYSYAVLHKLLLNRGRTSEAQIVEDQALSQGLVIGGAP